MENNLLKTLFNLVGFGAIGFVFFVWLLGNQQNGTNYNITENAPTFRSEVGSDYGPAAGEPEHYEIDREHKKSYKKPKRVAVRDAKEEYHPEEVYEVKRERERSYEEEEEVVRAAGMPVRNWKGVHRDESFAWDCFQRFGEEVVLLAEEYALYPEVLMARIITYSYEYVEHPHDNPYDNNFTGMMTRDGDSRARFRRPIESLRAYAEINAGERDRISMKGAAAKYDRSWTMQKIISKYDFVRELGEGLAIEEVYNGSIGRANEIPDSEFRKREMRGAAADMVYRVESSVKRKKAKEAGYDNWDEYIESTPEGRRSDREEEVISVSSAISKKKALNLARRVASEKKRKH